MNNVFWEKWNNEFRGYGEPTNNYNQNANHQVSNNSNSYNSWSNNWNESKQTSSDWNWNYFSTPQPKQSNPAKRFDPTEFINTEFMNTNKDYRANAKPKWDTYEGAVNTNYKFTNYSVADEHLTQASSGMKWNDPTNRVHNNYIQHYDDEYGWVNLVAVNKDLLTQNGKNVWNSDLHNTILDVELDNGDCFNAMVVDHCGASSNKPILDIWQYNSTPDNFTGKFTVKRKGGKTNYNKH